VIANIDNFFQIRVIISKNIIFFVDFWGEMIRNWGLFIIIGTNLKLEAAIPMRERANEK